MRRASTVAGSKTLRDDICPGLPEYLSIEGAFNLSRCEKYSDPYNPGVTQEVIDVPMQRLGLSLVSGQAGFQTVQRAARIDISPCREQERPQPTHLQRRRLRQMQYQLITSRCHGVIVAC